jgi:ribonuclease HII
LPATFRCERRLERQLHQSGYRWVAGVDEAGRGSLFGPVFAAAVILSPQRPIRGLNDSKLLKPQRREELAAVIRERATAFSVASVEALLIDRINILQASRLAMKRAIEQLQPAADCLILDAVTVDLPLPQWSIVHGDARCQAIAAASILAKVGRDAAMCEWDQVYPQYGLARHKGYGTPEHLRALQQFGPTQHHRFSFEPVRAACPLPQQLQFHWEPQEPAWK